MDRGGEREREREVVVGGDDDDAMMLASGVDVISRGPM